MFTVCACCTCTYVCVCGVCVFLQGGGGVRTTCMCVRVCARGSVSVCVRL